MLNTWRTMPAIAATLSIGKSFNAIKVYFSLADILNDRNCLAPKRSTNKPPTACETKPSSTCATTLPQSRHSIHLLPVVGVWRMRSLSAAKLDHGDYFKPAIRYVNRDWTVESLYARYSGRRLLRPSRRGTIYCLFMA